eukprot:COSAG01_NODE_64207_length_277_cov_0.870787_1_plen_91_part_11
MELSQKSPPSVDERIHLATDTAMAIDQAEDDPTEGEIKGAGAATKLSKNEGSESAAGSSDSSLQPDDATKTAATLKEEKSAPTLSDTQSYS